MTTGKIIKRLRTDANLTQDELSVILNVKKSSIQKYESGAVSNLKMDTIRTLCEYFKVPPWIFIFPDHIVHLDQIACFQVKNKDLKELNFAALINEKGIIKLIEYARDLVESGNYAIDIKDGEEENAAR